MTPEQAVRELKVSLKFFRRSSACLEESDSTFAPTPESRTVAQQVAHVAQTVDWFVDGVFSTAGFDMDFEKHERAVTECTSLSAAREWIDKAYQRASERFGACTVEELAAPLPANPILQGPLFHVVEAIADHTAHHRGALTVYARLQGRVPEMPYL